MAARYGVAVVNGDDEFTPVLRNQIARLDDCKLTAECFDLSEADGLFRSSDPPDPDLIVLNPNDPDISPESSSIQDLEAFTTRHPGSPVVVIIENRSAEVLVAWLRAGCRQVIFKPIDPDDFARAFRQALMMQRSSESEAQSVIFIGAGGGLGVTSLLGNVAVETGQLADRRIVMIEMAFEPGGLCRLFDVKPARGLADLLEYEGQPDAAVIRKVMTGLSTGVSLLAGGGRESPFIECYRNHRLIEVLRILSRMTDILLFDLPPRICSGQTELFRSAHEIVIVTQQNVPALLDAARLVSRLHKLGIDSDQMRLVVNRFDRRHEIDLPAIEKTVGLSPFATVESDYERMQHSLNMSRPLRVFASDSQVRRNIVQLACRLFDLPAPPSHRIPSRRFYRLRRAVSRLWRPASNAPYFRADSPLPESGVKRDNPD